MQWATLFRIESKFGSLSSPVAGSVTTGSTIDRDFESGRRATRYGSLFLALLARLLLFGIAERHFSSAANGLTDGLTDERYLIGSPVGLRASLSEALGISARSFFGQLGGSWIYRVLVALTSALS